MDSTTFIAILVGVAAIVPPIWLYAVKKMKWLQNLLDKSQLDEIAIGAVSETYDNYVRDLKAANEDGKLTKEEKKEAMSKAVGTFKDLAKDKGVKAAKDLAMPFVKGLIEKAINKVKGEAKDGAKEEAPAEA